MKVHNYEPEPRQCGGRRKFPQIDVDDLKSNQNIRKLMRVEPINKQKIENEEFKEDEDSQ